MLGLRQLVIAAATSSVIIFAGATAMAMGNENDANPKPRNAQKCNGGKAWGIVSKSCVKVDKARRECKQRGRKWNKGLKRCPRGAAFGPRHDDLFEQGSKLAYAGRYDAAIKILEQIAFRNDPRVLNMIGFSFRKKGMMDTAFAYYNRALAINPEFALARSYMGEGYVSIGKINLAKTQLRKIETICGTQCDEYKILKATIEAVT